MEPGNSNRKRRPAWVGRMLAPIVLAVACAPGVALGQWLKYPTAGVPRTADGKPNLSAPAPRLPGGKPDFSGIWLTATKFPCTPGQPGGFFDCGLELPISPLAVNIGSGMAGGLPYQPWAAALVKQRVADDSKDDPHVRCLPDNPPRPYGLPHLTKAMHSPRALVMLNEVNAMYRQIFIDGRPFPPDMNPSWNGYSVGHWEGDTLVAETRGFRDDLWADTWGSPMSEAAKMTEKFHRRNFGSMDIDVTIDDPKVYTKPFTVTLNESLEPDTELADEFCAEGEKDYERLQRSRGK
jgi:hypothetical protein